MPPITGEVFWLPSFAEGANPLLFNFSAPLPVILIRAEVAFETALAAAEAAPVAASPRAAGADAALERRLLLFPTLLRTFVAAFAAAFAAFLTLLFCSEGEIPAAAEVFI